jgi:hypothetical protein
MVVLVLFGYAVLVIYEFIPLYKQKQWSDFWVNSILGAISITLALLLSFDIKIPSPARSILDVVNTISGR